MNTVYLVCGVSGSGKTWVCKQLTNKFCYVPHDQHSHDIVNVCRMMRTERPLLTECPFAERLLKAEFEQSRFIVKPVFVIESPEICQKRYEQREGKPLPKAAVTRATTIIDRALEWNSPYGTAEQVLSILKNLKL
jgi:hypothetical protein